MSGGSVGPFGGMQDEQTGEITVVCDAESHELWERIYARRDDRWMPDPFEHVGGEADGFSAHVRKPRRGGGAEFIDAAGRVVPAWDTGRGVTDPRSAEGLMAGLDRARTAAGVGPDDYLPLGLRYQIRCPECGDTVRRAESKLQRHFNLLWAQGIYRITLNGLRELDRLV